VSESFEPCKQACGRPSLPGRLRCHVCMEKRRARARKDYRDRSLRGQCVYCQASASVGMFCFTHWLKNVGVPHGLGNKKGIAILQELWVNQDGRCAITGEKLIPGSTASIDHRIPKSKGGTSEKENLQWVLLFVNRIKWDMTNEEFVATCRKVVAATDRTTPIKNLALTKRSN